MEATSADSPANAVGCHTIKLAWLAEPGAAKVFGPIQSGGLRGEVDLIPGIVGLLDVLVLGEADVLFGDGMLQCDDPSRTSFGVGESRELQHG